MANHTQLLDDPTVRDAVTAYVDLRLKPSHRVLELHDDVLVRGWAAPVPGKPTRAEVATVEVVIATRTGRVYAQRYRQNLEDFLAAAHAAAASRTRRSAA